MLIVALFGCSANDPWPDPSSGGVLYTLPPLPPSAVDGLLDGDTVWSGVHRVERVVVVPAHATLTLLPDTTVVFAEGAELTVLGSLRAEGTADRPVRLVGDPGARWIGVTAVGADLLLDHVEIDGTDLAVDAESTSVEVRDSDFDGAAVRALGVPPGGHLRFLRNVFRPTDGPVLDLLGDRWPAPVAEVRENLFLGGNDDAIRVAGDLLLDGNWFQEFVGDRRPASAVALHDEPGVVVATRNQFLALEQVATLTDGAFGWFEHDTALGIDGPAIRLLTPSPTTPDGPPLAPAGAGAYVEGSVFADAGSPIFGDPDDNAGLGPFTSWLDVVGTVVPSGEALANADLRNGRRFDAIVGVPTFDDHRLAAGSLGDGAGRHGLDLGAEIPPGATVCCIDVEGPMVTFEVAGPGIFAFQWQVDGGEPSADVQIARPTDFYRSAEVRRAVGATLGPLAAGRHVLEVRGRDFAGLLQEEPVISEFVVKSP